MVAEKIHRMWHGARWVRVAGAALGLLLGGCGSPASQEAAQERSSETTRISSRYTYTIHPRIVCDKPTGPRGYWRVFESLVRVGVAAPTLHTASTTDGSYSGLSSTAVPGVEILVDSGWRIVSVTQIAPEPMEPKDGSEPPPPPPPLNIRREDRRNWSLYTTDNSNIPEGTRVSVLYDEEDSASTTIDPSSIVDLPGAEREGRVEDSHQIIDHIAGKGNLFDRETCLDETEFAPAPSALLQVTPGKEGLTASARYVSINGHHRWCISYDDEMVSMGLNEVFHVTVFNAGTESCVSVANTKK